MKAVPIMGRASITIWRAILPCVKSFAVTILFLFTTKPYDKNARALDVKAFCSRASLIIGGAKVYIISYLNAYTPTFFQQNYIYPIFQPITKREEVNGEL
jgi:hypothetical protein